MVELISGLIVMVIIAGWGYRRGHLTVTGASAAGLVGGAVWIGGRWALALPLVFFFVASSVLTRWAGKRLDKRKNGAAHSSARGGWQVAANGSVTATCALVALVSDNTDWLYGGLCALAAMTGDTWSSEAGRALARWPLDLRRFRRVEAGISGAVSLIGTAAGLIGAMATTTIGICLLPALDRPEWSTFLLVSIWAFMAGWVDSILGATIQMRFRCIRCGKLTDHSTHCGEPARRIGGIPGINNSTVNFLTTVFAAVAAILL